MDRVSCCDEQGTTPARAAGPSLSPSNNCIGNERGINKLTGAHKRMAHVVTLEIKQLAKIFGFERLGFLTLTFSDHVTDPAEAQKRFRSLNTNVISKRYVRSVAAWERMEHGRIHWHLVVVCAEDIRGAINFDQIAQRNYRSANLALRQEWDFWRSITNYDGKHPDHAYATFGRVELLPVKTNAEGLAHYVGKYVSKHVKARRDVDKGARIFRFSGFKVGQRAATARFGWAEGNGFLWRQKLKAYAARIGAATTEDLLNFFGPRWAFVLQDEILAEPIPSAVIFPSREVALRSLEVTPYEVAKLRAQQIKESKQCSKTYVLKPFFTFRGGGGVATSTDPVKTGTVARSMKPKLGSGALSIGFASSIATRIKVLLAQHERYNERWALRELLRTFPPEIDCPF